MSFYRTTIKIVFVLSLVALGFSSWAEGRKESTQFGGTRLDFSVGDNRGFVILPTGEAGDKSRPWVWYAPTFIGQLPDDSHEWMGAQLLEAGFAIAGVDVGESYGSPVGVAAYNRFYAFVVDEFGLDGKACLLAQSRGGLMLLNWAIENTGRVRCIAGIYAVCNIESYPGVDEACGAFGMTAGQLRDSLESHNPIERLESLARAGIPHLFIHGDADGVVPIEDNAGLLVERLGGLGGRARLVVVPDKGHEVCPEFFESETFVRFLLSRGELAAE